MTGRKRLRAATKSRIRLYQIKGALLGTITDPRETNPAPTMPWRRTGWRARPPCRPSVRSARRASRAGLRPVASDRASSTLDPHRADLGLAAIRGGARVAVAWVKVVGDGAPSRA